MPAAELRVRVSKAVLVPVRQLARQRFALLDKDAGKRFQLWVVGIAVPSKLISPDGRYLPKDP